MKCIVCETAEVVGPLYKCLLCGMSCIPEAHGDVMDGLVDVKSACCNADIQVLSKTTCSDQCHEKFVQYFETLVGKEKLVTSVATGKTYKVPTRYIIEQGLKGYELQNFPEA